MSSNTAGISAFGEYNDGINQMSIHILEMDGDTEMLLHLLSGITARVLVDSCMDKESQVDIPTLFGAYVVDFLYPKVETIQTEPTYDIDIDEFFKQLRDEQGK